MALLRMPFSNPKRITALAIPRLTSGISRLAHWFSKMCIRDSCLSCVRSTDCELQKLCRDYGVNGMRFIGSSQSVLRTQDRQFWS